MCFIFMTCCKKNSPGVSGRFVLNDVLPEVGQAIQLETPHDVIREQYWPGSTSRKSTYLFDQDVFHFYDLLQ